MVLADGVVAESGTHEELEAKGGLYARLLEAAHGDALGWGRAGGHAGRLTTQVTPLERPS